MANQPEPGWYLDPQGAAVERYWDGSVWTEHRRAPKGGSQPSTPAGTGFKKLWLGLSDAGRGWIVIALIAAIIAVVVAVSNSGDREIERACATAADQDGLRGDARKQAINFCVKYQEDFATR